MGIVTIASCTALHHNRCYEFTAAMAGSRCYEFTTQHCPFVVDGSRGYDFTAIHCILYWSLMADTLLGGHSHHSSLSSYGHAARKLPCSTGAADKAVLMDTL